MKTITTLALVGATLGATARAQQPWQQLRDPVAAGWDAAALDAARGLAEEAGSAAVMAVHRDQVVVAWGDVERRFKCHSVRKSILSALYGIAIERGLVDVTQSLADLGIDDLDPLSETEKSARVEHLLAARSGIYHPAAKEPQDMKRNRPARHGQPPGERFHYNNWDFNALGVIFNRETGIDLFAAFEDWLARPLGMQDFRRGDGTYELEPSNSRHPAYAFRLSARDLARFGWLYARSGTLGDRAIVPSTWIARSTARVTEFDNGQGYGHMWWVYPQGTLPRLSALNQHDVIAAIGTGGQVVMVVEGADFVFVHRADTDNDRRVRGGDVWQIADRIFGGRPSSEASAPVALQPITAQPLPGALPAPRMRESMAVTAAILQELAGTYLMGPLGRCEAHLHDGRLFVRTPLGQETELFCEAEDRWFSRTSNMTVTVLRDEEGRVEAMELEMMGRRIKGEKERPASPRAPVR